MVIEKTIAEELQEIVAAAPDFESSKPEAVLDWAWHQFGHGLTMATAFGAEGCILIEMLSRVVPELRIFNLETGYQFSETLALREQIKQKYGIEVEYVRADESVEAMEARFGGPIYGTDPDTCCRIRKVEPLKKALFGKTAWISAIRREQTQTRRDAKIVEWDAKFQLVKLNPLANWTKKDVWDYILANDVPYNPLHNQGYTSIGCWPCTRAVGVGEDDRAGRWSGHARNECGLHTKD